jgi:hypothetical protein
MQSSIVSAKEGLHDITYTIFVRFGDDIKEG